MARIGRLVVPELTHHVSQRGNRRERVFFSDDGLRAIPRSASRGVQAREGSRVELLPDAKPRPPHPDAPTPEGLGRALGEAHRRYSAFVNARNRVTGHLLQARFSSVVMDEDHLMAAARYVAMNPVRAGWSSARRTGGGRASGRIWRGETTGW